jgi:hypothetical protein
MGGQHDCVNMALWLLVVEMCRANPLVELL